MNRRAETFVDNFAESTAACLLAMVQGNLFALGVSHWLIASQTGLVAGAVTTLAVLATRARRPWVIATVLGATTTLVDFFVHPGMWGGLFLEALVTGLVAAILSYGVQILWRRRRSRATEASRL